MTDKTPNSKPSCEQIIDILPDPFVVIDRDYRIIAANHAYQRQYDCSADDITGRHCYEVSHHTDSPCSQHGEHCPLEEVFATRTPTQVMHVHYDKEGQEEYVQLQASPIFSADNEVMYMGEYVNVLSPTRSEANLLVGQSPVFLRLTSLLQRVAPSQSTVLLLGESGVGKEKVAEYIHQYSARPDAPFVVVDCGTLGENLIESELFGYEKGAFTGASSRKIGLFEAANGGTLFIDEIGELPLQLQTKLLRALESGSIRRIGGNDYIKVNVRVIAATNCDMQDMVASGKFRQDLYYRLSAFPVQIPPLREHKDDIVALAENFLHHMHDGARHVPLSADVIAKLMGYDYPGNIRELRNILERAVILACDDILREDHIVLEPPTFYSPTAPGESREFSVPITTQGNLINRKGRLSPSTVMQALEETGGHRARASRLLGVSERTLYRYIQRMR